MAGDVDTKIRKYTEGVSMAVCHLKPLDIGTFGAEHRLSQTGFSNTKEFRRPWQHRGQLDCGEIKHTLSVSLHVHIDFRSSALCQMGSGVSL
jgi:hypothetical protein